MWTQPVLARAQVDFAKLSLPLAAATLRAVSAALRLLALLLASDLHAAAPLTRWLHHPATAPSAPPATLLMRWWLYSEPTLLEPASAGALPGHTQCTHSHCIQC